MPLEEVKKGCFRWGKQGKVYCGPDAKKQALKQGYAENGGDEKKFKQELSKSRNLSVLDYEYIRKLLRQSKAENSYENFYAKLDEILSPAVAYIPAYERDRIHDDDFAGPGRTFPIRNSEDVQHAAMLLHHSSDPSSVKKKIIQIAKRKGLSLPDTWGHEG